MIIASNLLSLLLSPWHAAFMIIASNLAISIYYRLDTRQFDYRLEPGDIDIIALYAAIYDYRLEPGDIDIIITLDTRRNL
jgi:hypothetical protein